MRTTLLLLVLLAPGAESSEVYKWTDETGRIHYGEKPGGKKSENIAIPKHKKSTQSAPPDEQQRLENIRKWTAARQEEREQAKLKKAELKEKKAARKKKCNEMKNSLVDMQRRGRWYRLDEEGNRQYYSEEELETRIKEKAGVIKKKCR